MKFHCLASLSEFVAPVLLCPATRGAHNLIHPIAAATHRVEGKVGGTLVYRTLDPGSRVPEAVDELLQENGKLKQELDQLKATTKNGEREREKFFEGASWNAKQAVKACDEGL